MTNREGEARDPQAAKARFLEGVRALRGGQMAAAITSLRAAIAADETHFDAHLALGSAYGQSGRFVEAAPVLTRATTLRPNSAAAHAALGGAYDRQGLHAQAIEAFSKAVTLKPDMGDVHHRLSQLYTHYSRPLDAARHLDRAAAANPKTTHALMYRADAQMLRGDLAGAEQWARKAVMREPGNFAAQGTLGGLLYAQGRFEEAAKCFEAALRLNPRAAKAWDGLVHCRRYDAPDDPMAGRLAAALARGDLGEGERMMLHFALGKVLDDRGEAEQAMRHFDAGNALRARGVAFDRAGFAAQIDRTIALFTPDFIQRLVDAGAAASGAEPEAPGPAGLFIVGMYRSGTTLVEQIVSRHPRIAAGGELTVWGPGELEVDAAGRFDAERARAAMARHRAALAAIGPEAALVTDKLPFNFMRLGAIHALAPQARILHCRRDPIDTCLSIYSTLFNTRISFAARKSDLVFVYQQYQRMMAHWRRVLPAEALLDVGYETLIENREDETRRLIAFTGLAWDEACLAPEANSRPIATSSAWQARQPVYARSKQRWRRYEPWLGELRALNGVAAG